MQLTIARTRVLWLLAVSVCCLCSFDEASAYFRGHASSAATLSAQTAQADGTDHALLAVTTDTSGGQLYYVVDANCTTPSAAQIQAGQNAAGSAATVAGNQAVSASGQQTANPSGVSAVTTYCAFFNQKTSANSNVVGVNNFKTPGVITFTKVYDANFQAAQGGALKTAADAIFSILSGCFLPSTNITVTYEIGYGALSELGFTASTAFGVSYTGALRSQLVALPNKNTAMHALFDNPPASDPTGVSNTYYVSCSQQKAFGGACVAQDATTDFSSNFTYDAAVPPAACTGTPCFQSVALHEFTEGIGRQWGQQFSSGQPGLMEFSAYTSTGVRQPNSSTGPLYPSVNGGATNLISPFQYGAGCTTTCDVGDFTSAGVDAFTGFDSGQTTATPTAADIKAMTVLGWGLSRPCRLAAGL